MGESSRMPVRTPIPESTADVRLTVAVAKQIFEVLDSAGFSAAGHLGRGAALQVLSGLVAAYEGGRR